MRNYLFIGNAAVLFFAGGMLSCSRLGDSTDLGSNVINDAFPDKMVVDKHIRHYAMDSTALLASYSLPGKNDFGFGYHQGLYQVSAGSVSEGPLVLGTQTGERAAGYVQFDILADTAKKKFSPADTLKSVTIRFVRDSVSPESRIQVWHSNNRAHMLSPSATIGDSLLDTMGFTATDTSLKTNVPDTVSLPPWLVNNIFKACTTSSAGPLKTGYTSFGFILVNLTNDVLVRLGGRPSLTVTYKDSVDTVLKAVTYFPLPGNSLYYATDADSADSWQKKPMLVYSSERTAVFQYNVKTLWEAASAGHDTLKSAELLSAVFTLKPPTFDDTLKIRYFLWHEPVRDGYKLDSLFTVNPLAQTIAFADTATVPASVLQGLSNYGQETQNLKRYPILYLYLRLVEDSKQAWKRYHWNTVPLLKATIPISHTRSSE